MKRITLVLMLLLAASSARGDMPGYLIEAFQRSRWTAYSPTGKSPSPTSIAEMEKDLQLLKQGGFEGIVTYGCDGLKKEIPMLARKAGIKYVIVGVYDPQNELELKLAKGLAPVVDGYCVGNEGVGKERRYTLDQLRSWITELQSWTGRPVSTSEQLEDYTDIPELLRLGDWVFPNVHPYWHGITTEPEASRWTKSQVDKLRELAGERVVFCKEVGLPTGSLDIGLVTPTEEVQADYYLALRALDVPFVYFEAFDQVWKSKYPAEPFWGIYKSDRAPKRIAKLLATSASGIQFVELQNKGKIKVRRDPEGGFFEVRGKASGFAESKRTLLLFVSTGDFNAPGWFLQIPPNGLIEIDDDEWTARGQIGNRDYPPRDDQIIGLKVLAVPQEVADRLIAARQANDELRNKGFYTQDLPPVETQWHAEVKELGLIISP